MKFIKNLARLTFLYGLIGMLIGVLISIVSGDMMFAMLPYCIIFSAIGGLVGVFKAIIDDEKNKEKVVKQLLSNQIELVNREKLPLFYDMNRYSIYNAFLYIIIIIIVAIIYQYNVSNNMETPEKSFVVSLGCVFVVLTVGLLLTSSSIKFKDKIFWAKKEVGERYKILEYKQNKNNNELFISRDFMGKLNKMSHIHILRVYEEYIKINIHGYVVKIGTWTSMDRCSSYGHRLFVELEQNNNFNTQIIIKDADNWDEIINNIAIIPKYKNINFIYCKDNGYATSIITESIQKIISNLATQLKDFSMAFYETKILIVLHDTSWSTFFSRTFNRKKNAENIVKSAETIINTLEQIAREIDKNNK